jgi:hypothetical protein
MNPSRIIVGLGKVCAMSHGPWVHELTRQDRRTSRRCKLAVILRLCNIICRPSLSTPPYCVYNHRNACSPILLWLNITCLWELEVDLHSKPHEASRGLTDPTTNLLPYAFADSLVSCSHDQYITNGVLGPHHPHADSIVLKRSF